MKLGFNEGFLYAYDILLYLIMYYCLMLKSQYHSILYLFVPDEYIGLKSKYKIFVSKSRNESVKRLNYHGLKEMSIDYKGNKLK
jgi:hypothetical protein